MYLHWIISLTKEYWWQLHEWQILSTLYHYRAIIIVGELSKYAQMNCDYLQRRSQGLLCMTWYSFRCVTKTNWIRTKLNPKRFEKIKKNFHHSNLGREWQKKCPSLEFLLKVKSKIPKFENLSQSLSSGDPLDIEDYSTNDPSQPVQYISDQPSLCKFWRSGRSKQSRECMTHSLERIIPSMRPEQLSTPDVYEKFAVLGNPKLRSLESPLKHPSVIPVTAAVTNRTPLILSSKSHFSPSAEYLCVDRRISTVTEVSNEDMSKAPEVGSVPVTDVGENLNQIQANNATTEEVRLKLVVPWFWNEMRIKGSYNNYLYNPTQLIIWQSMQLYIILGGGICSH